MTMWEKLTLGAGIAILVGGLGLAFKHDYTPNPRSAREDYAKRLCLELVPEQNQVNYRLAATNYCEKTTQALLEYLNVRVDFSKPGSLVLVFTDLENLYLLSKIATIRGEINQIEGLHQHNAAMQRLEQ